MDKYSISQTPGTVKRPGPKKSPKSKTKSAISVSPQLIAGIAAGVLLIIAGVLLVRHFSKKTNPVTGQPIVAHPVPSTAGKGVITTASFNSVTSAVESKNLGALNRQYARQVNVVVPRRNTKQTVSASNVEGLIGNYLNSVQGPWNWNVSPSTIANWQEGSYGQYFTGNNLIGISADGTVISVGIDSNGQIDSVFIAPVAIVQTPGNTSDGSTSGSNSGAGTDTTTPSSSTSPGGPNNSD